MGDADSGKSGPCKGDRLGKSSCCGKVGRRPGGKRGWEAVRYSCRIEHSWVFAAARKEPTVTKPRLETMVCPIQLCKLGPGIFPL